MISWSENFSTGIARIDSDHKTLIAMINELEDAQMAGRGSRVITDILVKLAAYAQEHFICEEGCMHRYQCANADANRQAHVNFSRMIAEAQDRLNAGNGALIAKHIHLELADWLVSHVLKIDSSLRGCSG